MLEFVLSSVSHCLCLQACSRCLEGRMRLDCPKPSFAPCAACSLLRGTQLMQHFQPGLKPPISIAGWVECGFAEADYRVKLPGVPSQRCCSTAAVQVAAPAAGGIALCPAPASAPLRQEPGEPGLAKKTLGLEHSQGGLCAPTPFLPAGWPV